VSYSTKAPTVGPWPKIIQTKRKNKIKINTDTAVTIVQNIINNNLILNKGTNSPKLISKIGLSYQYLTLINNIINSNLITINNITNNKLITINDISNNKLTLINNITNNKLITTKNKNTRTLLTHK
jgi:hypothetical protein